MPLPSSPNPTPSARCSRLTVVPGFVVSFFNSLHGPAPPCEKKRGRDSGRRRTRTIGAGEARRVALWRPLGDGHISQVVSDVPTHVVNVSQRSHALNQSRCPFTCTFSSAWRGAACCYLSPSGYSLVCAWETHCHSFVFSISCQRRVAATLDRISSCRCCLCSLRCTCCMKSTARPRLHALSAFRHRAWIPQSRTASMANVLKPPRCARVPVSRTSLPCTSARKMMELKDSKKKQATRHSSCVILALLHAGQNCTGHTHVYKRETTIGIRSNALLLPVDCSRPDQSVERLVHRSLVLLVVLLLECSRID